MLITAVVAAAAAAESWPAPHSRRLFKVGIALLAHLAPSRRSRERRGHPACAPARSRELCHPRSTVAGMDRFGITMATTDGGSRRLVCVWSASGVHCRTSALPKEARATRASGSSICRSCGGGIRRRSLPGGHYAGPGSWAIRQSRISVTVGKRGSRAQRVRIAVLETTLRADAG